MTGRWSDGRRGVEVTVVRGAALHSTRWLDDFLRGWKRLTSPVAGPNITGIRTAGADGRTGAFWVASDAAVHVTVSPELAGELDRITTGVRLPVP
ncbi:hypothetical protein [Planomonospora parontospora]|uniref:hypothetical protein n=1 Tax=Planomonospora parontospora TaxID=58119 RepID=UPI00166FC813|nr:hypothetical protein [Planomonospora parontospora]GGL23227.1 hypothetical protein GCM10014719_26310 [Planomonospora parontospora subsp. antibiotica]GII14995.1 hypothetical protein Ppa05_17210 [Planomonospora parontospora subsp. antibiotica]